MTSAAGSRNGCGRAAASPGEGVLPFLLCRTADRPLAKLSMLCASCRLRKPGIGWPSSLVRRAEIDERREAQLEACGRVAPGYGDLESAACLSWLGGLGTLAYGSSGGSMRQGWIAGSTRLVALPDAFGVLVASAFCPSSLSGE